MAARTHITRYTTPFPTGAAEYITFSANGGDAGDSNRLMIACVSYNSAQGGDVGAAEVPTFNGVSMTSAGTPPAAVQSNECRAWYLVNPASGAHTFSIRKDLMIATGGLVIHVIVYKDIDQATPLSGYVGVSDQTDFSSPYEAHSTDITSEAGDIVFGWFGHTNVATVWSASDETSPADHTGATLIATDVSDATGTADATGASLEQPGAATVRIWAELTGVGSYVGGGIIAFNLNAAAVAATTYTVTELTISSTAG